MDREAIVRAEFTVTFTYIVEQTVSEWEAMVTESSDDDLSLDELAEENGFTPDGDAADYVGALLNGLADSWQGTGAFTELGNRHGSDDSSVSIEETSLM